LTINYTQVRDLTPLKSMPLTGLYLRGCGQLENLTLLRNLPLSGLDLSRCEKVKDLAPLRGLPVTILQINDSPITDLTPLQGMKLTAVYFTPRHVTKGMDVLRNMETLKTIGINDPDRYSPEVFWRK